MIGAIKTSLLYRAAQKLLFWFVQFLQMIHTRIYQPDKAKRFWSEKATIYPLIQHGVSTIGRFQDTLNRAGRASLLFGRTTWLRRLFNALDIVVLLVPFNFLFIDYLLRQVGFLAFLSTIWDELALLLAFAFITLRPLWKDDNYRLVWRGLDWLVCLFIAVGTGLLLIVSPELDIAIEGFRAVYQHILWYFIMRQLLTVNNRIFAYRSVLLMGAFLGFHALYQYITKVPMPGNWVDSTETISTRAFSIIGSPNILGAMFVLIIPLVGVMIYTEQNWRFKLLAVVALPAMVLGLLFTFARQAYLALFLAVAVFFIIFYPKIIKYLIILVGAVLAALPSVAARIYYLFTPEYFTKSARGGRVIRYLYAIEQWLDKPLLGQGLGRFGGAVATHHELTPFYVDSYYLKTLGEMGAVGLISMLGLFISVVVYAKNVIKKQALLHDALLVAGLFIGVVGIVLQNSVENIFEVPMMIVLFWGFVALIQTYDHNQEKSNV